MSRRYTIAPPKYRRGLDIVGSRLRIGTNKIQMDSAEAKLRDDVLLLFGDGTDGPTITDYDVKVYWDASQLVFLPITNNTVVAWGNGTLSLDQKWFGSAAANYMQWDASANTLSIEGTAGLLRIGAFSQTAKGSGSIMKANGNTAIARVYADDNGAAAWAAGSVPDQRVILGRYLLTTDQTGGKLRTWGVMGHIKGYNAKWDNEQVGGTFGVVELVRTSGIQTLGGYGVTAGLHGMVYTQGTLAIDTNHVLAGVAAVSNVRSGLTQTGKLAAFYAGIYDATNWSDSTARTKWGYGLYIPAKAVDVGIAIGDFASSYATGSALALSSSITAIARFYGESTADQGAAYNLRTLVTRHLVVAAATINHETYGGIGQLCVKSASLGHYHAGFMGTYESNTAATILTSYGVGALIGRVGAENTTVNSGGLLAGVLALENTGTITNNGYMAAFAAKTAAGKTVWPALLYNNDAPVILQVPTASDYEAGAKLASVNLGTIGADGGTILADGVLKIKVGTVSYYVPFFAASTITGE